MAAITFCCFIAAVLGNVVSSEWAKHPFAYTIGAILLASPFLVLLPGHVTMARSLQRNVFFLFGNLLLAPIWFIASFALRWFQPGWPGVLLFSFVLSGIAGLYLLCGSFIREQPRIE